VIICTIRVKDQLNIKAENCFKPQNLRPRSTLRYVIGELIKQQTVCKYYLNSFELFVSIIFSLPAIYRHCGNDYLGFDIGLICHGLGLGLQGLDWS